MDITIRPARPGDLLRLTELLAELFALESDFEPDIEKQVRGLSLLLNEPSGTALVIVAVYDDAVIGMATVQTLISTAEGGRVGLVEDVIVDRKFRSQGVGTMLLERIEAWSKSSGLTRLQLLADRDNQPAHDFYTSQRWISTRLICLRKKP